MNCRRWAWVGGALVAAAVLTAVSPVGAEVKLPVAKPKDASGLRWNTRALATAGAPSGYFFVTYNQPTVSFVVVLAEGKEGVPADWIEAADPAKKDEFLSGTFACAKKKWTFTLEKQTGDPKTEKELVTILAKELGGVNLSVEGILGDPELCAELRKITKTELSEQNVDFVQAVDAFQKKPTQEAFAMIFDLYLRGEKKSSKAINRSDKELTPVRDLEDEFRTGKKKFDAKLAEQALAKLAALVTNDLQDSVGRLITDSDRKKRLQALEKAITVKGFKESKK